MIQSYVGKLLRLEHFRTIKQKELEFVDWDECLPTEYDPASWYPGGVMMAANYRGPHIHPRNHFYSEKAQEAWLRMERAKAWSLGHSCQIGHTADGNPFIRMVVAPNGGTSMWYPLFEAAK